MSLLEQHKKNDLFMEQLDTFINYVNSLLSNHWKQKGYTFDVAPSLEAEFSKKWVRIYTKETKTSSKSIYCFIVNEDHETKFLGKLTKGDIHKPATRLAPAKHARGNIFHDFKKALTKDGQIIYLK